jgi:hypothetical protein
MSGQFLRLHCRLCICPMLKIARFVDVGEDCHHGIDQPASLTLIRSISEIPFFRDLFRERLHKQSSLIQAITKSVTFF